MGKCDSGSGRCSKAQKKRLPKEFGPETLGFSKRAANEEPAIKPRTHTQAKRELSLLHHRRAKLFMIVHVGLHWKLFVVFKGSRSSFHSNYSDCTQCHDCKSNHKSVSLMQGKIAN